MANVIVTITIMPDSPEVDLKNLEESATKLITEFGGDVGKVDVQPVAFGLKSVGLIFVMDEAKGSTEQLEQDIAAMEGVASAEVTDIRRALG